MGIVLLISYYLCVIYDDLNLLYSFVQKKSFVLFKIVIKWIKFKQTELSSLESFQDTLKYYKSSKLCCLHEFDVFLCLQHENALVKAY